MNNPRQGITSSAGFFFYHLAGNERLRAQHRIVRVAVVTHGANLATCYSTVPLFLLGYYAHGLSTFDIFFYALGMVLCIFIEVYLQLVYCAIYTKKTRQLHDEQQSQQEEISMDSR